MAQVLKQQVAGPVLQRTVLEDGRLYNDWHQAGRGAILDENRVILNARDARKLGWGEPSLRIPELDLVLLKAKYPDLASRDGLVKRRAWIKFLNDPESAPYRVQPRGRSRLHSVGGI